MAPLTLATTAASFLIPYLAKAGEKAFETIGEKSVDSLWQAITAKFTGKPVAEEAARDLLTKPDDQLNQATFANQLRKVLEADPAFAVELGRLLISAQHQGSDTIIPDDPAFRGRGGTRTASRPRPQPELWLSGSGAPQKL